MVKGMSLVKSWPRKETKLELNCRFDFMIRLETCQEPLLESLRAKTNGPRFYPGSCGRRTRILMARATGFQIYVCRPDADGKPAWTLKAPEAELFDEQGKSIGKHFGGPTWQLNDGSQITGKMAAKADAPDPKAIPWLLVTVTGHSGRGKLSAVTSIQRVNTVAGLAPESLAPAESECSPQSGEVEFKSSYQADYYFYARR